MATARPLWPEERKEHEEPVPAPSRPKSRWPWILLGAVVLLAVGAVLVLHSARFHNYVLAMLIGDIQQATGGRTEIADYEIHWHGLKVDMARVIVHGTEADVQNPLFKADQMTVGLKIGSLIRGKVDYHDIVLQHPVIRLLVDAQGHTNIPTTPATTKKPQGIFDMAINHVTLNDGEIYYNDRHIPLTADLHDLQAQSVYRMATEAYEGSLSYHQGHVRFGNFNSLDHDFDAQFSATPPGVELKSLKVRTAGSSISVQGHLKNYENPEIDAFYQAILDSGELRRVTKNPMLPSGRLLTNGTVNYTDRPGQPPINGLSVTGKINSPFLAVVTPQARTDIRAFAADYRLGNGSVEISNVRGNTLGGRVDGRVNVTDLSGRQNAKAEVKLSNISLDDVLRAAPPAWRAPQAVSGSLKGKADANWHGSLEDLEVRSDATITAKTLTQGAASAGAGAVPLDGALHLAYSGRSQLLTLRNTSLKTPHSTLNLNGTLGNHANLTFQANSNDLREVERLAIGVESIAAARGAKPQPPGLAGAAAFNGTVSGRLTAPQIAGQLSATNVRYRGANLSSLRAGVSLSPSQLALHQGDLVTSAQGHVTFDASVGLRNWTYNEQQHVDLRLTATNLPVQDLQRLAGYQYPVTGTLAANIAFSGSEANPAGSGSVDVTQAKAWAQPIQHLSIEFQGTGNSINSTLNVTSPAGSANGTVNYFPKTEGYDAKLSVPAVHLEQIQVPAVQKLQLSGTVSGSASGQGTLKDPQLEANIKAPNLEFGEQKFEAFRAQATVAHEQANVNVSSIVTGAALQARGTVNLTGDYQTTANVDSQTIRLGPLLAAYWPQYGAGIEGQTQIHATLNGPLKDPNKLVGEVELPTFSVAYENIQVASANPVRLDYRAGILTVQRTELKGSDTDVQLQATVPIQSAGAFQAAANGAVDLRLVKLYNPQYTGKGQVNLDLAAQGPIAHPDVHGTVRLANAAFGSPDLPLGIQNLNGELDVAGGRVQVNQLAGEVGGGSVSVTGYATYQPAVNFNLGITADTVRFRYPEGLRTLVGGDLSIAGTLESSLLSGQLVIDRFSTTPDFDLEALMDQFSGEAAPAPSSAFLNNMRLNVTVTSSEDLAVASTELSVQGYADLRVQGTAADPVILGRANLTGGELFFRGKRFQLENATITFVNPVRTEPVLRMLVTTTVDQFDITMNFIGPIDRLRTTYTSDPPLSSVDIINLLVTGHTTASAQTPGTTPQGLLAEGLASRVGSRVQKFTGLSSLTIDPQLGGNQGSASTTVAIQQRVTKNLLFSFATDVSHTQGELVQFTYQFSKKYAVSGTRNQAGGYQLQLKMHKTF